MRSLIIHYLCIFDPKNKVAKKVDLVEGINVITSDKTAGNDVGKSILMKSIYHTLGADSIFDDNWYSSPKIYSMSFSINQNRFLIFRSEKLFKIYSGEFQFLFSTSNRSELSEYLMVLYGFSVKLPHKTTNELEVAPPAYSYLLNYVDQDHMDGPKFNSFDSLYQFKNDKEGILFNHFGIYTDEYFATVREIERLRKDEAELNEEILVIDKMLKRITLYLDGMDIPVGMGALRIELERDRKEYTDIVESLKTAKINLIKLRNEQVELESGIKDLLRLKKLKEKDVEMVNENYCPTCYQEMENERLKISQNSQLEDFYIMKNQLEQLLLEVERKVHQKEALYQGLLGKLNEFEENIKMSKKEISDVAKHRGYLETRNQLLIDSGSVQEKLSINKEAVKESKKILKKYNDLKKQANELYEQYMVETIVKFGLEEIDLEKFKKVNSNFKPRGSNIPITTIIWYYTLLKIKYYLNENVIRFPIVLDSPNNVELDENKESALFDYIFTQYIEDSQLIVSTLGFDTAEYPEVVIDNVILLNNKKYNVLNKKDYEENKDLLNIMFDN
ncbi:hypothetical protein ACQCU1_18935 [Sutcliffiella horikoshii]|uniref:hypothetical protein n=1 Tax=Sutcliffiella horikoshii TaxID=79883 RepID=UPI003CF80641